jgi:hypothetical protein
MDHGLPAEANLTFALPKKSKDFLSSFPRSPLASADSEAQSGVVETYPLEVLAAQLR